jgi:aconitate hydratase/homoaconitate hydratase
MEISDPRPYLEQVDPDRLAALCRAGAEPALTYDLADNSPNIAETTAATNEESKSSVLQTTQETPGSAMLRSRVQCFGDHVDTDAIIPGEFCHLTDPVELGERCFTHVRPDFLGRVRAGEDIIVAGHGWGSGSSREQAVWALKGAGVKAVVARSFAFIHKRNLVNEALPFLVIEDEAFYERVEEGAELALDLARGVATVGEKQFTAVKPSSMVGALAAAGGIVPAVREYGAQTFARLQQKAG